MKKKVVATFLAILMACQGNVAYASQIEVTKNMEAVTPEFPEEYIHEETVNIDGNIENTSIYWSLDGDTLTINNTGSNASIPDYTYETVAPWYAYNRNVKNIVIGSGIIEIGDYAFYGMEALQKVTINSQVLTSVGAHAFDNCENLKDINLPDTVTHMGVYAFARCGKIEKISSKGLETPPALKVIPEYAFAESKISEIVFSEAVEKIDLCAFYNCDNLTNVGFTGNSLKTIEDCAFMNASELESMIIPDGVESIGVRAFYDCGCLKNVGIKTQGSLTEIGTEAFDKSSNEIKFYVMPNAGYVTEYLKEYLQEDFEKSCVLYQYMSNEKKDIYTIQIVGDTTYTGKEVTPKVSVTKIDGEVLEEGVDYILSYADNVEAGDSAKVIITGIDAYYGTMDEYFTISKKNIEDVNIQYGDRMEYTGEPVILNVTITDGDKVLEEGVDYTVEYTDNVNAGDSAKATITGINLYCGTVEKTFTIYKRNIEDAKIKLTESMEYTGEAVIPDLSITDGNKILEEGVDYTVEYSNNIVEGDNAKVTITGINFYCGTVEKYFTIGKRSIEDANIQLEESVEYTGEAVIPSLTIIDGSRILEEGVDYTVECSNNINAGNKAKITITGINRYKGVVEKFFAVTVKDIKKNVVVDYVKELPYTGKAITPEITVKVNGIILEKNKDYTVKYSNNVNASKDAKIIITGMGGYTGTIETGFSIYTNMTGAKITVKKQVYTGKKLTPAVKVVLNGKTLVKDKDYKVSYTGNKNVGKNAKVVVKGIGNYKGEITQKFTIAPKKPKIKVTGYKVKITNYKKGADVYVAVKVAGKKAVKIQCTAKNYNKKKCVDLTKFLKKYKGKKVTFTVYMKQNSVSGASAKKTVKKL